MRGAWGGSGLPVVLIHGQPGSAGDWDRLRDELPDVRVLAPDRPGYDGSPASDFAGNARLLSELLVSTGVERAVLVGHSWGGGVALQMALDHPEQVAGLCLVSSIGSRLAWTWWDRVMAQPGLAQASAVAVVCTPAVAPRLVALATGSRLPEHELAQVRAQGHHWRRGGAIRAFVAEQRVLVRHGQELAARLGEVTVPTLVVTGDRDRTVTPRAAADLARALPRGELLTVPGGHLLLREQPQLVARAVRRVVADADW